MRYICTKESPWTKDKGRAVHPDAHEIPGSQENRWPSGDTVWCCCPHCGHAWPEELAQ